MSRVQRAAAAVEARNPEEASVPPPAMDPEAGLPLFLRNKYVLTVGLPPLSQRVPENMDDCETGRPLSMRQAYSEVVEDQLLPLHVRIKGTPPTEENYYADDDADEADGPKRAVRRQGMLRALFRPVDHEEVVAEDPNRTAAVELVCEALARMNGVRWLERDAAFVTDHGAIDFAVGSEVIKMVDDSLLPSGKVASTEIEMSEMGRMDANSV